MRYKTLIYQLNMLYKFLALSLLLYGCSAQSNSSDLSADISGPFTDLDENIFYSAFILSSNFNAASVEFR